MEQSLTVNERCGMEKESQTKDGQSFLGYKLLKQVCYMSLWLAMGLCMEIIGPTIPDLRASLGFTYEEVSRGLASRSGGFFVGSVIGGILHELLLRHTDLLLSLSMLTLAVGAFFIPWSSSIYEFAILLFMQGFSAGIANTGANPKILELWGEKSFGPMNSMHFTFGLGAVIVPQIAKPFLSPNTEGINDGNFTLNISETYDIGRTQSLMDTTLVYDNITAMNVTTETSTPEFKLYYPYAIVSIVPVFLALALFITYLKGPPEGFPQRTKVQSGKYALSTATCAPDHPVYGGLLLLLLFFFYFQTVAGEYVYGTFIASYAIDAPVGFTKSKAATLSSVFWASFLAGRFSGIFLGHILKVQYILILDLVLSVVTYIFVIFLSGTNEPALWALTVLGGYLPSLLFAAGLVWANMYLFINSMATMICLVGFSLGGFAYFYATGFLFHQYGVDSFGYILLFYAVVLLLLFITMQLVVTFHGSAISVESRARLCVTEDIQFKPVSLEDGESDDEETEHEKDNFSDW